jgi:hypothetical protein
MDAPALGQHTQPLGHELRAIVRTKMLRHALSTITSASAPITLALDQLRSQRISRHARVYSSIRFKIRTVRPSCVFALTKS